MPKISIIIPVYNVEKYLRRCLDSVINQTFSDWQAICVNDGCTDKCGQILEEYAEKDKRFIVLKKINDDSPSGARNLALKHATGEYVMCLDSDDFIHPQTMEINLYLAQRDNADIVAFTYDRAYRPYLMVRHLLGLDTENAVPYAFNKKYKISKIKTLVTDDVFKYATEQSHHPFNLHRRWLIKHCQVWKNMYRRDLIKDIKFIDGILFEDFPWWCEVLLKKPHTTIVNLPLYFYRPNFKGIVLSAKQKFIMISLFVGLKDIYAKYEKCADDYQMKKFRENFLWFFIARAYDKIKYLKTAKELNIAKEGFIKLTKNGVLDNTPKTWCKLKEKICNFIKE